MKFNRFWLLIPALIPLAFKFQYIAYAWKTSPLDRRDWIFPLTALVLTAFKTKTLRHWLSVPDCRGVLPATSALLLYAFFIIKPVSTFQIAAGILFFFSALWILGGRQLFCGCMPLLAICLLACPSTTYWSEFYLRIILQTDRISGFFFKLLLCTGAAVFFLWRTAPARLHTVLYCTGLAILGTILAVQSVPPQYGMPLIPDTSLLKAGEYLVTSMMPSDQELRFFEGNRLLKSAYYGDSDVIYLLSVEITGNIHRLHPTELCLKSKKTVIHGLHEKTIPVGNEKELAVQELTAVRSDGKNYLIYTWYTGPEWSTGNFLVFRKNWRQGNKWKSFQMLTEINGTKKSAAARLDGLLQILFSAQTEGTDIATE